MRGSGIALAILVILTSAALVYRRANTAIEMQWVQYESGVDSVRAFVALPQGQGPFPAIIVFHEWWGLNEWVKSKARALAGQGYLAMAVDLYRGEVTADASHAHELMRGVPEDRAIRDLKSAFAYLSSRSDVKSSKIGSIGWCMGGGYSLQTAVHVPGLAACVINYGKLVTDEELLAGINAPLLGIFGAQDRGIPVKSVKAFEASCRKLNKAVEMHVFSNSGHAFMNENNQKSYNGKDAVEAWQESLAFFEKHLK